MAEKIAIFVFRGESICFTHALLNAIDLHGKGHEVKLVIEGAAPRALAEVADARAPHAWLYQKAKAAGLIDCVCKACAAKADVLAVVEAEGLPLCGEMSGHPAMSRYIEQGYRIVTL